MHQIKKKNKTKHYHILSNLVNKLLSSISKMNIATVVEFIESMIKSATVSNTDGAYGSGMAGTPFDPLGFIKKPQVILRIVSLVRVFQI